MSGVHARIAPSSMARTVQCPASVTMAEKYPEPDGPDAAEGEAAHWAFAEIASGETVSVGQIAPNGVALDFEMLASAEMMADTVTAWRAPVASLHIERPVAAPSIHAECWGTPDADAWVIPRARLKVADLKHGHGFVSEYEFWQGIAYVRGLFDEAKITGAEEWSLVVEITIVQPRSYHRDGPVRAWTTTGGELRAYFNIAKAAAAEALGADPTARVGPECRYCPARRACPALHAAGGHFVQDQGRSVPLDLTTDQAAAELRRLQYALGLAKARASGLEAQLLAAARTGQSVPFFHVEHGQGNEVWSVPVDQVIALGELMGQDLRKPVEVVTPTKARKLGIDVPGFSARGTGEAKLVPDNPHRAVKIFGSKS